MKLTLFTDYAMRMLFYLTARPGRQELWRLPGDLAATTAAGLDGFQP